MAITGTRVAVAVGAFAVGAAAWWSVARTDAQKSPARTSQPAGQVAEVAQVRVASVVSQYLDRELSLPGELVAFQDVEIRPKVQGFVESIGVDRGSVVKRGQPLARLVAPELEAQRREADMKIQSAEAQRLEADARLASDEATYQRLKNASATPGVVAGNDVDVAQKTVEADRARVELWKKNEQAARDAARSVREIESYLKIAAPFDGIVTERTVHPGSLVGPSTPPMLRIQEVGKLRLVVYVPEVDVAGIAPGRELRFTVPAFPAERFSGTIARVGHALDPRTRTMAVELDVPNSVGQLAPGMFSEVVWSARRPWPSLFVPATAVATTTERTFVVRVRGGIIEWVDVRRGAAMKDLVEVFGDLREGDQVAARGTDELRPGMHVRAVPLTAAP